jgi:hypothetical protein
MGLGFSVATPNPLYVWGNYNCTNPVCLGTTNTSATVPCAFYCDAFTILAEGWSDPNSLTTQYSASSGAWNAEDTTINAAILTGIVPSTGSDSMHFSGGVHNSVRFLQDWSGCMLTLNTSLINLYNSRRATGQFLNPGVYYSPPTRKYSHDPKFFYPSNTPPGMPIAFAGSPLIFSHLQTIARPSGSDFSIIIGAAGYGALSYQWSFNGTNIDAATNNLLSLTNLQVGQSGIYSLTVADAIDTNTADVIDLVITNIPQAPVMDSFALPSPNQLQFTIHGVPGWNYVVQSSTDLVTWDSIMTNVSPFDFADTNIMNSPQRFYRAVCLP